MNSHETAELARNEHPGIMRRGVIRFKPSRADRDMTLERDMSEAVERLYEHARVTQSHDARQIARTFERALIAFSTA